ncbi:hypothetical protein Ae406Ps2_5692 [Pseudonocardia sp. Ae406_Ps2]|nr:hypothetical protein Ae331Ps2_0267c [Pseudonocardia sp. Ae331_Ps2]OLM05692.1 hypothetical protein Ae406Ps2_5692 [Pseudonocardia sp. Ae406_Ps2]OLM15151.1 hypothetical protein Ae505Ps2_5283c [Pseudonocardia sp. Ae505_Ps2]OLM27267.1 hypothetical protein Ae706Ps2_5701 [Pseudonocardia sp. Ae706_Ps2]
MAAVPDDPMVPGIDRGSRFCRCRSRGSTPDLPSGCGCSGPCLARHRERRRARDGREQLAVGVR